MYLLVSKNSSMHFVYGCKHFKFKNKNILIIIFLLICFFLFASFTYEVIFLKSGSTKLLKLG